MPDFTLSTTAALLLSAKAGDERSRNSLAERCLPRLQRMACGRVPKGLAGQIEADDLVQETLLRAFSHLDRFEPRCEGAFIYYLRRILMNVIHDFGRKVQRSPPAAALDEEPSSLGPSPVEDAVGAETWERYRQALSGLTEAQAQAVVLFVECGMDFQEIAAALESPSANAARMVVARGLKRLSELMHVPTGS